MSSQFNIYYALESIIKGWKILFVSISLFLIISFYIIFTSTPAWKTVTVLSPPNANIDYKNFYLSTIKVNNIYISGIKNDIYNTTKLSSEEYIYNLFVKELKNSDNLKYFLKKNNLKGKSDQVIDGFISKNFNIKKNDNLTVLYFIDISPKSSYDLLNKYVEYTSEIVSKQINNKFSNLKNVIEDQLVYQYNYELESTKLSIKAEINKSKLALQVAEASEINSAYKNVITSGEFDQNIILGSKLLKSKIDILSSIKDYSSIDAKIGLLNNLINEIKSTKGNVYKIKPFNYEVTPIIPYSRSKPNKRLIFILGIFVGLSVGISIVFLKDGLRNARNEFSKDK